MSSIPEPYVWSEDFSVADEQMDTQHKGLFTGIDNLCKNPTNGDMLKTLVDAVVTHFECEEKRMKDAGAVDDDHLQKHASLLETAGKLAVPVNAEQQEFLKNWLVNHIKMTDIPKYKGKLK